MKNLNIVFLLLLSQLFTCSVFGQKSIRLENGWEFLKGDLGSIWEAVRPYSVGSPESVPIWSKVTFPHCYNAEDAVDPDVNYYQGPAWYRKSIRIDNPYKHGRTLLHFEGAGQKTEVYLYTTLVATHVGGYDEWTVDITDELAKIQLDATLLKRFKGNIPLSIRVDNSRDVEMMPSDLSDFNVYGGIYRYLNLTYMPENYAGPIWVRPTVDEKGKVGRLNISGQLHVHRQDQDISANISLVDPQGHEVFSRDIYLKSDTMIQTFGDFEIKKPTLWHPDAPMLYTVVTSFGSSQDRFVHRQKIGFRHFEFVDNGPFKLNGDRLLLRGTHRHEDHAGVGAAMTETMIKEEMQMMKDMGVNFIRLGHYQQSRIVLDACDSLGILVWEEIPWCRGGIGGEIYQAQGKRMLTNMINQHYNHPSIIIWGLGNENDWPNDFPEFDQEKIRTYMKELHDLAHQLDDTRKTAIRRCDFCKDIVDVYSPSIWAGWYRGVYTDYKASTETEMKKVKHFLHVEWGGDSHAQRHAENPDKALAKIERGHGTDERAGDASLYGGASRVSKDGDWSESYICNLIDWHLKEQETMPWLTGTAYWPFKDFSTPVRPENPVPYVNQKGVVERDFKKKESYYVFQSYWTKKPMLHIYGHTWPVRWGEKDEEKMIKVYSNVDEVELFVNGKSQGVKKRNSQDFPAAGLRWLVHRIRGKNTIKAVSKGLEIPVEDQITQVYQIGPWGKPAKLELKKIDEKDHIITIEATMKDADGRLCLDAMNWVTFSTLGESRLLDNLGTSDGARKVQLYNGRAQIKVKVKHKDWVAAVQSEGFPTVYINR